MSLTLMSYVWDSDLPPTERIVMLRLADQANDDGMQCWPSIGTIARKTGMTPRSVQRIIRRLEQHGYITTIHRHNTSSVYRVNIKGTETPNRWPKYPKGGDTVSGGGAPDAPLEVTQSQEGGDTVSGGGGHSVTQTVIEPKDNQESASHSCGSDDPPARPPVPSDFVEVWNDMADEIGLTKVRGLTPERTARLKARIAEHPPEDFHEVFDNIRTSDFLRGNGKTAWHGCTFDWVTKKTNFLKILEGNYSNG